MNGKMILDLCGGTGTWSRPWREATIRDERDTLMKRHREQVEVIRKRIDSGGLTSDEERLLKDLHFETNYDRRCEDERL
jgi:ubiquinone/menaquinone biosynthesis C-methylase UbiE